MTFANDWKNEISKKSLKLHSNWGTFR